MDEEAGSCVKYGAVTGEAAQGKNAFLDVNVKN
jgi:hypothetical protein